MGWQGAAINEKEFGKSGGSAKKRDGDLSDEDDGNEVFARKHAITDSALMKKVSMYCCSTVPCCALLCFVEPRIRVFVMSCCISYF